MPRWGRLHELKGINRVPSPSFSGLPGRLKHLAAWRRMHMTASGHRGPHMAGVRAQRLPSSNLTIKQKLKFIANATKKGKL